MITKSSMSSAVDIIDKANARKVHLLIHYVCLIMFSGGMVSLIILEADVFLIYCNYS